MLLAIVSFFLLSRSGKKEGVNFTHNRWIFFLVVAAVLGAVSGLYDKYLMAPPENGGVGLSRMVVQSWYNIYQLCLMGCAIFAIWYPTRKKTTPFHWRWSIVFISIFLSIADFVYFYALSLPGAMISIVSMVRRGSVVVSFFLCQVEDDHLIKAMDDVADAWWMPLDKVNPDDFGLDSVRKGVARFLETCRNKK